MPAAGVININPSRRNIRGGALRIKADFIRINTVTAGEQVEIIAPLEGKHTGVSIGGQVTVISGNLIMPLVVRVLMTDRRLPALSIWTSGAGGG